MNTRFSRFLAYVIAFSMVISTFAIVPMTVSAAGVDYNTQPYASTINFTKDTKMLVTEGTNTASRLCGASEGKTWFKEMSLNSFYNYIASNKITDSDSRELLNVDGVLADTEGLLPTLDQGKDESYYDTYAVDGRGSKGIKTFDLSGKIIKGVRVVGVIHANGIKYAGGYFTDVDGIKHPNSDNTCVRMTPAESLKTQSSAPGSMFLLGKQAVKSGENWTASSTDNRFFYTDLANTGNVAADKFTLHLNLEDNGCGVNDGGYSAASDWHQTTILEVLAVYEVEYSFNELDTVLKSKIEEYNSESNVDKKNSLYNSIKKTIESAQNRGYDAYGRDNGWKLLAQENLKAETTELADKLSENTYPMPDDYNALVSKLQNAVSEGIIDNFNEGLTTDSLAKYNAAKAIVESELQVESVEGTKISLSDGVKITFNTPIEDSSDVLKSKIKLNGENAKFVTKSDDDTVLTVMFDGLDYAENYSATILSTIENIYGKTLTSNYSVNFSTQDLPKYTASVDVPLENGEPDPYADTLTIKFSIPTNAQDATDKVQVYKNGVVLGTDKYTLFNSSETNIDVKLNEVLGVNNTYIIKVLKEVQPISKYASAVTGLENDLLIDFTTPSKDFDCTFSFDSETAKFVFTNKINIEDFKSGLKVLKNDSETNAFDVNYAGNEVTVTLKTPDGFIVDSVTPGTAQKSYKFIISDTFTDLLGQTLTDREFSYTPDKEYVSALSDTLTFSSTTAVEKSTVERYFDIAKYNDTLKQYMTLNVNQDYTVSVDGSGKNITVKFSEPFGYENKFRYYFYEGFKDASGTDLSEHWTTFFETEAKPTDITLISPASDTDVPADTTVVKFKLNTYMGIESLRQLLSVKKGNNDFTDYSIEGIDSDNVVTLNFNNKLGNNQVYEIIVDGAGSIVLSTKVIKTYSTTYINDDFENGLSSKWRVVGTATVSPEVVNDPDDPNNKVLKVTSNKYNNGDYKLFRDFDFEDNNSESKQILVSFKYRWYTSSSSGQETSAGRPAPCMVLVDKNDRINSYIQAGGHSLLRIYDTSATPDGSVSTVDTDIKPMLTWMNVKYIIDLESKSITFYRKDGTKMVRYFASLNYDDLFKSITLTAIAANPGNSVEASYYFDDLQVTKLGTDFIPSNYDVIGKGAVLENVEPSAFEFNFPSKLDASTFDASTVFTLMDAEGNEISSDKLVTTLTNDNRTISVVYSDAKFNTLYKFRLSSDLKDEHGASADDSIYSFKTSDETAFDFVGSLPSDGTSDIAPSDKVLTFEFSAPVNQDQFKNYFTLKAGTEYVNQSEYTIDYSTDGTKAIVTLNKAFGPSKTYSYKLSSGLTDKFYDMSSNKSIHILSYDVSGSFTTLPVAFEASRIEPIKDMNVAVDSDEIVYTFTTPVEETTLRNALKISKNGAILGYNDYSVTIEENGDGCKVTLKLAERFGSGKTIIVETTGLKDVYGQSISNEINDTFRTQYVEFKMLSVTPVDGSIYNTYDKAFKIKFTTRITKDNFKENFVLKKGTSEIAIDSVSVSEDGLTATVYTVDELGFGVSYSFDFKDGFRDEYDQTLVRTEEPVFGFTSDTPAPGIAALVSPSDTTNVEIYGNRIEVKLKTPVLYEEFSKNVVIKRNGETINLVGYNPDDSFDGDYSVNESEDNVSYIIYMENDKAIGENDGIFGSGNTYEISLKAGMKDIYGNSYDGSDSFAFKSKAVPLTFTLSNNIIGSGTQLEFHISTFVHLSEFMDKFTAYKNGRKLVCYREDETGAYDYKVSSNFNKDLGYQSIIVTFNTEFGFGNEIKYEISDSITDIYGLEVTKGYDESKTVVTQSADGDVINITDLITFDDMDELTKWKTTGNPLVPAKIVMDPLDDKNENKVLCLTGDPYTRPDGTRGESLVYTRELQDIPSDGSKIYITFDYLWGLSQSDTVECGNASNLIVPRDSNSSAYYTWWLAGNSELRLLYTAETKDETLDMNIESSRKDNISSAKYDTKWTTVKTIIDPAAGTMQYCIGSGTDYITRYIKPGLTNALKDLYVTLDISSNGMNGTNKGIPYYIDNLKVTRVPVFALKNHIDAEGKEFSLNNVDPLSSVVPVDFTLPVKGAQKNYDITKMITIKKNGVALPAESYTISLDESSKQYNAKGDLLGYKTMNIYFADSALEYNTNYTIEVASGVLFEEYATTTGITETTFSTSKSDAFHIDSLSGKVWNLSGNALTVIYEPKNAAGTENNVFVMIAAYDSNDKLLGSETKLWNGSNKELTVAGINKDDVSYIKVFSFNRDLSPLQLPLKVFE